VPVKRMSARRRIMGAMIGAGLTACAMIGAVFASTAGGEGGTERVRVPGTTVEDMRCSGVGSFGSSSRQECLVRVSMMPAPLTSVHLIPGRSASTTR
jgi:hypothetical protein